MMLAATAASGLLFFFFTGLFFTVGIFLQSKIKSVVVILSDHISTKFSVLVFPHLKHFI